jgi:hypothetical protein
MSGFSLSDTIRNWVRLTIRGFPSGALTFRLFRSLRPFIPLLPMSVWSPKRASTSFCTMRATGSKEGLQRHQGRLTQRSPSHTNGPTRDPSAYCFPLYKQSALARVGMRRRLMARRRRQANIVRLRLRGETADYDPQFSRTTRSIGSGVRIALNSLGATGLSVPPIPEVSFPLKLAI